jgi:hypothetical protein
MFYDAEDDKPILVDGQLVVYAFDEAGRAPTDNKPTRRYVFPPDQVARHMSENDMGASYSFWLPWDEAGGPKAEISLICRFEPKGGAVVTGEQTRHILPGSIPTTSPGLVSGPPRVPEGVPMRPAQTTLEGIQAQQNLQQQQPNGVQTAGYEVAMNPPATAAASVVPTGAIAPARQMAVTSIALPNNFQLPEGTQVQPISTATGQPTPQRSAQPAVTAVQYQQPQYQQPATAAQPVMQTAPAPMSHGAAMLQQGPGVRGQWQAPNPIVQSPIMTPINSPGVSVPQNAMAAAPMTAPQYTTQQPMMAPAGQPMMSSTAAALSAAQARRMSQQQMMRAPQQQLGMASPQQVGSVPQQQMMLAPMQPAQTMPVQQMAPQQSYQQLPTAGAPRTAVSYGPATLPWR